MLQTELTRTSKFESITFVDLDFNFKTYTNKDVKTKLGENAIKQSIKNLLMFNKYEKHFQSDIDAGLQHLLFEPLSSITAATLEISIRDVLNRYEPRISLESVSVYADDEKQRYDIIITFSMIQAETIKTTEFFLERLR